jgi:hypothetical protein
MGAGRQLSEQPALCIGCAMLMAKTFIMFIINKIKMAMMNDSALTCPALEHLLPISGTP